MQVRGGQMKNIVEIIFEMILKMHMWTFAKFNIRIHWHSLLACVLYQGHVLLSSWLILNLKTLCNHHDHDKRLQQNLSIRGHTSKHQNVNKKSNCPYMFTTDRVEISPIGDVEQLETLIPTQIFT